MASRQPGRLLVLVALLASILSSFPLTIGMINTNLAFAQSTSIASEILLDFNGDGYEDLAIGAPGEEIAGLPGAGGISVLYGTGSGLQASSPNDQFWNQNSPGVNDIAEDGDNFGRALAAGDFNDDGFTDLAIGVEGEDFAFAQEAGAVHVLYGSSMGLQTTSPADQFWRQNSPGLEDEEESVDRFGLALAAGDFNNDGFADLAIGAPQEDIGEIDDMGAVHILYGSSSGLRTSAPGDGTGRADQLWHQDRSGVEDFGERFDWFGFALASADFNGDGFDDLAIGAPAPSGESGVNVLYGSKTGLQTSSPSDQYWDQDSAGISNSVEEADLFGNSLSAGDFNADGIADLAIGVPTEGLGGGTIYAGAVHTLYGAGSGLQTSSPAQQFWHQNSLGVDDSAETVDQFGYSLAAGDFNNDGYDDLAIGVAFEHIGEIETGAVNVLHGSATGLQTSSPADQFWHENTPGMEETVEEFENFGYSLGAHDFNADGYTDLAIGNPSEDLDCDACGAGVVHILYGSNKGLQVGSPPDQLWHQDIPAVEDAVDSDEFFGAALS